MAKLFSSRIELFDEWVLVRVPDVAAEKKILVPQMGADGKTVTGVRKGVAAVNTGIVVGVGPGRQTPEGKVVPIDSRITPGATICFFGGGRGGATLFRPPDFEAEMAEEGLYLIPANVVVFALRPAGMPRATVMA